MVKRVACVLLLGALAAGLGFSGDAAAFVDFGFSNDGKIYIFGEYGKTDVTYQGYAAIYTIDVTRNDYVPGGVYRTEPGSNTRDRSSTAVFTDLYDRIAPSIYKYSPIAVSLKRTLFLRENEAKSPAAELYFKDYERATGADVHYAVRINPTYTGSGAVTKSTLSISVEERDSAGTLRRAYTVGNPSIVRTGITAYAISKVFTDETGHSLVFVVEKTLADNNGPSIRYMVETAVR